MEMANYIKCKNCDSTDCKGCNLKNLEMMLKSGKFDCLMNGNHWINPAADVAPVRHGRWEHNSDFPDRFICYGCGAMFDMWKHEQRLFNYCPNCGAKMDGGTE